MEENKSKKKIIIAIISIVILGVIIIRYNNTENKENNDTNIYENETQVIVKEKDVPENILAEKIFGDVKLKDIDIYAIEGATIFKAKVENISDKLMKEKAVTIIFNGNNGEECDRIEYSIESLKKGESIEIDFFLTTDITNIKDISVEVLDKKITE